MTVRPVSSTEPPLPFPPLLFLHLFHLKIHQKYHQHYHRSIMILTHSFLHCLYALTHHEVSARSNLQQSKNPILKVILAHSPIPSISPQTFQTSVCSILTRIEVFAVAFTVSTISISSPFIRRKAMNRPIEPRRAFLPIRLFFAFFPRRTRHQDLILIKGDGTF